jgi:PiT family inorganic phosphate transporter
LAPSPGPIRPRVSRISIIRAALVGAIAWNLFTWYYGIPSSSSHALIGGLLGATTIAAGLGALDDAALFDWLGRGPRIKP